MVEPRGFQPVTPKGHLRSFTPALYALTIKCLLENAMALRSNVPRRSTWDALVW